VGLLDGRFLEHRSRRRARDRPRGLARVQTSGLFILPPVFPVTPANANYTAALIAAVLCVSAALYYAPFIGGRHWFTGPAPNLE
jgi:hypothetical protein